MTGWQDLPIVTSFGNPQVKAAQKLRMRKYREETGLYLIEGMRIVLEALDTGAEFDTIFVSDSILEHSRLPDILRRAQAQGAKVLRTPGAILEKIAQKENPQGLIATLRQVWEPLDRLTIQPGEHWVALEEIRDPGNLGTILRTMDAVAAAGLILIGECCDPYSLESVRASMGAILGRRIAKTSLPGFFDWRRGQNARLIGTSLTACTDYRQISYEGALMIAMGNEQKGLSTELERACDEGVKITMIGRSDSLNLAIATGLILYEALYQTRRPATLG